MPTTTETLRDAFVAARRDKTLLDIASLPVPGSLHEAFAVQRDIAQKLGMAQPGWKVGIAGDGTPVAGLMQGPFLKSGDVYEGAIGAEIRIEIELAVRIARDIPVRPDKLYTRAELLGHCDKTCLGIEIVESRMANWEGVAYPLWLADAIGHGGFLVGPDLDMKLLDDQSGLGCFISLNGVTIYDQPAVHPNGDPLAPFLAWANRREDALFPLEAGQIVTTGSLCGGVIAPGKGEIVTRLSPLATVSLNLR